MAGEQAEVGTATAGRVRGMMRARAAVPALGLFAVLGASGPVRALEGALEGERLIVLGLDGAAHHLVLEFLDAGELPNFARLRAEGAFADGMITAFPSKTAASFAMIWTGLPGSRTGITGNAVLAEPPESHSLLDTRSGFSAELLRADPLWTRVARAGGTAVALHTTHTYPLESAFRRLDAAGRERLSVLTGYGDLRLAPEVLREATHPLLDPADTPSGAEAAFRFRVGESAFLGVFLDDARVEGAGWDTFAVLPDPPPERPVFLARVPVGDRGGFSTSLGAAAATAGGRVEFAVRAFAADAGGAVGTPRFLVLRTGASETAFHPAGGWGAGGWTGRLGPPAWPRTLGAPDYVSGRLGPTHLAGGEGLAEERLLEIAAHLADALLLHLEAATRIPQWNFIALYFGVADEMGHLLYGLLDERLPSHDPELAARLRPVLGGAFAEADRVLGRVLERAEAAGAHVLVVSDHGMAGTDRRVHVNTALERAGLLEFAEDGRPDLSRTRAMLLTTGDGSVAVNRASREQGIVSETEAPGVLAAVREALLGIRGLDGEPVVTGFLEASGDGVIRPGGASTGELFPTVAPGFVLSPLPGAEVVTEARPAGNHGFLPTRRDMLGVLAGWGPRIPAGARWPRASALDVAPTALDLLDLAPDPELPGRSLFGGRAIVPTSPASSGESAGTERSPRR